MCWKNLALNIIIRIIFILVGSILVGLSINDGLNSNIDSSIFISSIEYSLVSIPFVAYSEEQSYFYINNLNEGEIIYISDIAIYQLDNNNVPLYCDYISYLDLEIYNTDYKHCFYIFNDSHCLFARINDLCRLSQYR